MFPLPAKSEESLFLRVWVFIVAGGEELPGILGWGSSRGSAALTHSIPLSRWGVPGGPGVQPPTFWGQKGPVVPWRVGASLVGSRAWCEEGTWGVISGWASLGKGDLAPFVSLKHESQPGRAGGATRGWQEPAGPC